MEVASNNNGAVGPQGESGGGVNRPAVVRGKFIWHGGNIRVNIGADGGDGGAGGQGGKGANNSFANFSAFRGARGGPGGGGGGGLDSFLGGIIGRGAEPTDGAKNPTPTYGNESVSYRGSYGIGAPGGCGEGNNTNYREAHGWKQATGNPDAADEVILGRGKPGSSGEVPSKTESGGHVKVWRIG